MSIWHHMRFLKDLAEKYAYITYLLLGNSTVGSWGMSV